MSLQVQLINQTASPILTVTHWPQTRVSKTCGVVIAPAVGAEYFRSHWAVRRLADQLSRAGFPVLRFDYQGIGDSTGDVSQVGSLATWKRT